MFKPSDINASRARRLLQPALGMALLAVPLIAFLADTPSLRAEEGEGLRLPASTNANFQKECSACHMAFQPQFLPARSWQAVMGDLANHFGEDASLAPDVAADITAYLVANAGDAKGARRGWAGRIPAAETPLRITETPGWIRKHRGEVSPSAFTSARVKSKSNCVACHAGAEKGYYEDD